MKIEKLRFIRKNNFTNYKKFICSAISMCLIMDWHINLDHKFSPLILSQSKKLKKHIEEETSMSWEELTELI